MAQPRAWQRMLSGRRLDLLDPAAIDIEVEDIAHGLAFLARWNGQTIGEFPYSVAEHSLLVEKIFRRLTPKSNPEQMLIALLHDAPEYVIGDMISPVKASVGLGYDELDKRLAAAIHIRFGLSAITPKVLKKKIKKADRISAWLEATQLAGFSRSGVICEIIGDDGEMLRGPELMKFAKKHSLKIISIEDLIRFRRKEVSGGHCS